jgi:hypothetical protein
MTREENIERINQLAQKASAAFDGENRVDSLITVLLILETLLTDGLTRTDGILNTPDTHKFRDMIRDRRIRAFNAIYDPETRARIRRQMKGNRSRQEV